MNDRAGVVLAAGLGARMKSSIPKVLHKVCGKEMILYPVQALRDAGVERVLVVVSSNNEEAIRGLLGDSVDYVLQSQLLGTGHALLQAAPLLRREAAHVAVLGADTPLIGAATMRALWDVHLAKESCVTFLSSDQCPEKEMGRVVRDGDGRVVGIVEWTETDDTSAPGEVNAGAYYFKGSWLWENLERISVGKKGEFYLTSLATMAAAQREGVEARVADDPTEALGINNRVQMAQVEGVMYQRVRHRWMLEGVTMVDPASTFIDASVELDQDTVVYPNTMVLGATRIGKQCQIGPGSVIRNSQVGDRCIVTASFLEGATLEEGVDIGPFSHLRPGAYLEKGVHLGNFSEVKNSRLGQGSVMGHFGYVGDASIGSGVNLGAGTVTCNYDGVAHHQTVIEEGAFIGCDTMLVAPVRVGADSITGAGAVVTKDVAPGRLVMGVPARIKKSKRVSGK